MTPTPAQTKHRNRLWAQALVENRKKARGKMKDAKTGGRCCLRVAEDLALQLLPADVTRDYTRNPSLPATMIYDFYGWYNDGKYDNDSEKVPMLELPDGGAEDATTLNDSYAYKGKDNGLSHAAIAECVLNTFVHPKKQKWSLLKK